MSLVTAMEFMPFVWSTFGVVAAILVGQLMTALTPFPNVSMIFLIAVLFPAVRFGVLPALFASVLSFLSYNFFFTEPYYTFNVALPHEFFALITFFVVAIVTSALAGRIREQVRLAANRMRATRRLYEFTKKLSGLATLDAVAEGAATEINASLDRAAVVLLDQDGDLALRAAWPPEDVLDPAAMTAARWAFSKNEPAGSDTSTLPSVPWLFVPLRTSHTCVGVLGVAAGGNVPRMDSEARTLFDTLAEQTAAALERASLAREMVTARTAAETERVRNTLLASISHDFRTPLSSILGAATSLLEFGQKLDPGAQKDLLGQIRHEAEDLDEMIRNLLAITRIDAGVLELRRDWIDLREIVERVVSAVRRRGAEQAILVDLPPNVPLVRADATLAEQAIGNVIGNAVSHTATETRITVDGEVTDESVAIRVTDNGRGIPPEVLPRVFDKFFRAQPSDSLTADGGEGTGLGLAIAKGIMEAHGGSIAAASPVDVGRGTRIILTFARSGSQAGT
jgi:two-component system sensor histidine kinase KdpD